MNITDKFKHNTDNQCKPIYIISMVSAFILATIVAVNILYNQQRLSKSIQAFSCASIAGDAICSYIAKNRKVPSTWEDINQQLIELGPNYACSGGAGLHNIIIVNFHILEDLSCDGADHKNVFIVPAEDPLLAKVGIDSINKSISDQYHRQVCGQPENQ